MRVRRFLASARDESRSVSIDGDPSALFDASASLPSNRPRPVRCCNDSVVDCFCSRALSFSKSSLWLGPNPGRAASKRASSFAWRAERSPSERDSTPTHASRAETPPRSRWLSSQPRIASRASRNPRSRRPRARLEPPASRAQRQSHPSRRLWPPASPSRSPFPPPTSRWRSKLTSAIVISSPVRLSSPRCGHAGRVQ